MLPTSRNTTYTPASFVRPADLNDLQDNIIGRKYPSTPLYISGSNFVVDGPPPSPATRNGHVWTFQTAATQLLVCGIRLIPGTRITDILWSYNRNTASFLFELHRRSFGNGGLTSGNVSTQTISTGTGWTTVAASNVPGMPHIVADGFMYLISVTATSAGQFDGVKLIADRL